MAERSDINFPSGSDHCAAWLYEPAGSGPHPVVVLAHGFAGTREVRLDAFAERFCAAGMAALVFDYRHFGASSGEPRQLVDISRQLADWRAAIAWVRAHARLDDARVALWGTSFSGGHVLAIAAEDHGLAAVVAQVPFTDGRRNGRNVELRHTLRLLWAGVRDRLRGWLGAEPLRIPVAGAPGSLAVMTTPDAEPGYRALLPAATTWRNEVAARVVTSIGGYRPGRSAARIRCPLLVCVAMHDAITPAEPAVDAAHAAPLGEALCYPIQHFDAYVGAPFEQIVADQTAFLRRHLAPPREAPPQSRRPS